MLARGIFQFQLRRAFASKTLPYALLFSIGVMCACFMQMCLKFWGHDTSEAPSAVVAWVGNCDATETNVFSYFINYMMAPVAAAIFGDSFCADVKGGLAASGASRSSFVGYVLSGAAAAFIVAFLAVLAVLLGSQLLAFLAFPISSAPDAYQSLGHFTAQVDSLDHLSQGLFGDLRVSARLLCNLIFCIQAALWAGALSAASYAVSLLTRGGRLLAIGVPTLAFLVANVTLPQELAPYTLLTSPLASNETLSLSFVAFVLEPLAVLLLSLLAVFLVGRFGRDVLL